MQLIFVRFTSVYNEINVTFSLFQPAPTNKWIGIDIMPALHETSTVISQQVSESHLSHLQVNKNTITQQTYETYETVNILRVYQVATS